MKTRWAGDDHLARGPSAEHEMLARGAYGELRMGFSRLPAEVIGTDVRPEP